LDGQLDTAKLNSVQDVKFISLAYYSLQTKYAHFRVPFASLILMYLEFPGIFHSSDILQNGIREVHFYLGMLLVKFVLSFLRFRGKSLPFCDHVPTMVESPVIVPLYSPLISGA